MGSRQSFATPHSRVPSAMIGQNTLKPDTHSNRDTGTLVRSARLHLERLLFRRAIMDFEFEHVAPLAGVGLLRLFTVDGESV